MSAAVADASLAPASRRNPMRWIVFAVVLGVNVMDGLDATIVNIAGPTIHLDLGGGTNTVQWLSAGYTLTFGRTAHRRRPAG
ncbi:MFS transporter [Candidatus Frankia alpina]|uniref:MFS transporter n=1 Tax=Candidatus Frankia alpina TaxID=2699483 RepID=A0A4S5DYE5_9ACTN|nr:MFS transporter [Candidatus Frankia alpina]THJ63988.1 MFS transporter [Candidatus Frankia alpina]